MVLVFLIDTRHRDNFHREGRSLQRNTWLVPKKQTRENFFQTKGLTESGEMLSELGISYLADTDRDPALAPLHSSACTYRIALGPRAGQKVLTVIDQALAVPGRKGLHA